MLSDQDQGELVDDLRYGSSSDLFATAERIVARHVAAAKAEALQDAADELQTMAVERFDQHGPHDQRGATEWDAADWLRERAARIGDA